MKAFTASGQVHGAAVYTGQRKATWQVIEDATLASYDVRANPKYSHMDLTLAQAHAHLQRLRAARPRPVEVDHAATWELDSATEADLVWAPA
jgi:hypothetical protein